LALVDPSFLATLRSLSVAERCLKVARYFGDIQEIDFWILAVSWVLFFDFDFDFEFDLLFCLFFPLPSIHLTLKISIISLVAVD
jgi:hypothetical protein